MPHAVYGIILERLEVFSPCELHAFDAVGIRSCSSSLKHSIWLSRDGLVYTAGDNDSGQLGRAGKRTKPFKIDSIEHMPVPLTTITTIFVASCCRASL